MNTAKVKAAMAEAGVQLAALGQAAQAASGSALPGIARMFIQATEDTLQQLEHAALEGRRVRVHDGSGTATLGEGTLIDHVTVYVRRRGTVDGEPMIQSDRFAEVPREGFESVGQNPKIQMDDGTIRYGCQVWWELVEGTDPLDLETVFPDAAPPA